MVVLRLLIDVLTKRDLMVIKLHDILSNFSEDPFLPFGVSYLVTIVRSSPYLKKSIESILPYASEIIVVDGTKGNDHYLVVKEFGDKVQYFHDDTFGEHWCFNDLVHALNLGKSHCSYRWIFKWDCDMVALEGFQNWVDKLKQLDPRFYYEVDVARIDSSTVVPFGGYEARLYTQHKKLKYFLSKLSGMDQMIFPLTWKLLRWNERYIQHCYPK